MLIFVVFDGFSWTLRRVLDGPLETSILLILGVVVKRSPMQHVLILHLVEICRVCWSVVDVAFVGPFPLDDLIEHSSETHQLVIGVRVALFYLVNMALEGRFGLVFFCVNAGWGQTIHMHDLLTTQTNRSYLVCDVSHSFNCVISLDWGGRLNLHCSFLGKLFCQIILGGFYFLINNSGVSCGDSVLAGTCISWDKLFYRGYNRGTSILSKANRVIQVLHRDLRGCL